MRTSNKSITPTLAEVIQTMIDSNLIEVHVCLPAKIVTYDSSKQSATVIPSLIRMYEDGTPLPWPPIPNVPVVFPKAVAGQAYMHMPLVPSDDVLLVICERSIDNWKQTGTPGDPSDRRKFNISDAFAIPGASAGPFVFNPDDPKAIEFKNILSMFQLKPTGEIVAKNAVATMTISPGGTISLNGPLVNVGSGASHGIGLGDVIESRLTAIETALSGLITGYNTHIHPTAGIGAPTLPPIVPDPPFVPVPTPAASLTAKVST